MLYIDGLETSSEIPLIQSPHSAGGSIMVANSKNMTHDGEIRCGIDLGPAPIWSLLLEP